MKMKTRITDLNFKFMLNIEEAEYFMYFLQDALEANHPDYLPKGIKVAKEFISNIDQILTAAGYYDSEEDFTNKVDFSERFKDYSMDKYMEDEDDNN